MILVPIAANLLMLAMLIYYRKTRKFREDRIRGLWAFLDANIVELTFFAMLVPDVADVVMSLMNPP
jgi:hypothetical protein